MQAITDKTNDSAGVPHPTFDYTHDRASRNGYRGGIALTMSILAALLAQPLQASATAPLAPPTSEQWRREFIRLPYFRGDLAGRYAGAVV